MLRRLVGRIAEIAKRRPKPVVVESMDDFDRLTIGALARAGADLDRPAEIVFASYLPSDGAAGAFAEAARLARYATTITPPDAHDPALSAAYCVLAKTVAIPSLDTVRAARTFFTALAERHGGEYDGWFAEVVK